MQPQQAGTVSGMLKDAEGRPLPSIRMAAIARVPTLDEAVTSAAMSSLAETDEQGRYTLEAIPPGRYFIAAGRLDAPTYYPGTTDMATAREVLVTAGSTVQSIDFALGALSFGRASPGPSFIVRTNTAATIPLRVTVEGGGKVPLSANGKFIAVKLDMGAAITTPISSTVVNIPDPQNTAYRVSIENLPETYVVKALTYGTKDLLTSTLQLTPFTIGYLAGLAAASSAQPNAQQVMSPVSYLSITLARVLPKPSAGVRVSGRLNSPGNRMVYASGIPGIVYSDGTFDVYGLPPGRHSIVTRDNRINSRSLAASVVVANDDLDGIVLEETALLPNGVWEPSEPRPAGDHPAGIVPLAGITGTLLDERSRKPITEGKVMLKSSTSATASFPIDAEGRFELPPLLPGTYDVEVQVFGHSSAKQSIEIDDKDVKLELLTYKLY